MTDCELIEAKLKTVTTTHTFHQSIGSRTSLSIASFCSLAATPLGSLNFSKIWGQTFFSLLCTIARARERYIRVAGSFLPSF